MAGRSFELFFCSPDVSAAMNKAEAELAASHEESENGSTSPAGQEKSKCGLAEQQASTVEYTTDCKHTGMPSTLRIILTQP